MPDGRFPFELVSGAPVVTAPEELDITNAPGAAGGPAGGSRYGKGAFVVDMTRSRFCDSSGLHTLLAAQSRPGRRRRAAARHRRRARPPRSRDHRH